MTLEGTNTWVLRAPDAARLRGRRPRRARRGAPGAGRRARPRRAGPAHPPPPRPRGRRAPLRGADRGAGAGARPVAGAGLRGAGRAATSSRPPGCELRVLATPGHTSDSLSFLLDGPATEPAVLTGDTVLGRGTTVIAHPDGALGAYLGSLRRLAELAPGTAVLPGHGPELPDAPAAAAQYLAHREERLDQVRAALERLGPHATAAAGRRARLRRRRPRALAGRRAGRSGRSWTTCGRERAAASGHGYARTSASRRDRAACAGGPRARRPAAPGQPAGQERRGRTGRLDHDAGHRLPRRPARAWPR